jgi:uncharacterized protein (DUF983 family)
LTVDPATVPAPKPLTLPRLLGRGLLRRCPLCGNRGVFDSWFQKKDRCPTCNLPLKREEGHWIGALGMNTVATFGLMIVALTVSTALTWEHRRAAAIFVPTFLAAGLTPILFFGSSQTLWSAIDLAMRPLEPDDDVDPRWIPANTKRREGW